jgi:hypothetical protein
MAGIDPDWQGGKCARTWPELNTEQQRDLFAAMRRLPKKAKSGAVASSRYHGCLTWEWVPQTGARTVTISYRYTHFLGMNAKYIILCLDWNH